MYFDDSDHEDDEFYHPEEVNDKEKSENAATSTSDIQAYIMKQRPENPVRQTVYDMNMCRRYFHS